MDQRMQGANYHIEHVLPESRGGATVEENLALSCPTCNLRKGSRIDARDPESGDMVPLFNPRIQTWSEHFRFEDYRIIGSTAVGRATCDALQLNELRRILIRRMEEKVSSHLQEVSWDANIDEIEE